MITLCGHIIYKSKQKINLHFCFHFWVGFVRKKGSGFSITLFQRHCFIFEYKTCKEITTLVYKTCEEITTLVSNINKPLVLFSLLCRVCTTENTFFSINYDLEKCEEKLPQYRISWQLKLQHFSEFHAIANKSKLSVTLLV